MTRSGRLLLIALFAALQLVLQPLGSTARCAVALAGSGESCCCGPVEASEAEAAGCCDQEAPSPKDDEDGNGPGAPCGCSALPTSPPATSPVAPEELRHVLVLDARAAVSTWQPAADVERSAPAARVRVPGDGPPLRLLIQVFRL